MKGCHIPPIEDEDDLILQARRMIQHKATSYGLYIDCADVFNCPHPSGGHLVALKRHYTWHYPEDDGEPEKVYHDLMWLEYPPGDLFKGDIEDGILMLHVAVPRLMMRLPTLVYWVRDGEVTCVSDIEKVHREQYIASFRKALDRMMEGLSK